MIPHSDAYRKVRKRVDLLLRDVSIAKVTSLKPYQEVSALSAFRFLLRCQLSSETTDSQYMDCYKSGMSS